jgi:hypothetical protein
MSKIETNTIDNISGSSALQIGDTNTATIGLGKSGDTITIPSGATIVNSGTATNFGDTNYFSTTGFSAYIDATQSVSSATETTCTFNTERFDMGNNFNTSTYIYETPSAGKYFFQYGLMLKGNSDTVLLAANVSLKKDDGAGNFSSNQDWENNFSANYINKYTSAASYIVDCEANRKWKVNVYISTTSGTPSVQGTITNSYFAGWRIA